MIYETSDHQLYFLPDKGELFVSDLTMSHFSRLTPGTLLDGKSLMAVVEDSEGWLWVATNKGMYRFDKKTKVVPFNFADGIPSLIFINCIPIKDEEGNFWFGNSRGLVRLNGKDMDMLPSRYIISCRMCWSMVRACSISFREKKAITRSHWRIRRRA